MMTEKEKDDFIKLLLKQVSSGYIEHINYKKKYEELFNCIASSCGYMDSKIKDYFRLNRDLTREDIQCLHVWIKQLSQLTSYSTRPHSEAKHNKPDKPAETNSIDYKTKYEILSDAIYPMFFNIDLNLYVILRHMNPEDRKPFEAFLTWFSRLNDAFHKARLIDQKPVEKE